MIEQPIEPADRIARALTAYKAVWASWPELTSATADACRETAMRAALKVALAEVFEECAAIVEARAAAHLAAIEAGAGARFTLRGGIITARMLAAEISSRALLVDMQLAPEPASHPIKEESP